MDEETRGRPELSQEELDSIFRKLEPHLQSGKTLYKACLIAQIPKSSVYKYYGTNEIFTEKIDGAMAYASNLVNNLFFGRLVGITRKDQELERLRKDLKEGKLKKEEFDKVEKDYHITPEDWAFIKWFAVNSHTTRGEYTSKMELTGEGGQPLVPESPLKEVAFMLQELLQGYGKTNPRTDTGDKGTGTQILQEQ